jgi:hypothetical protein
MIKVHPIRIMIAIIILMGTFYFAIEKNVPILFALLSAFGAAVFVQAFITSVISATRKEIK